VVDEYIGKNVPGELLKFLKKRKALEIELRKIREGIIALKGRRNDIYEFIEPLLKNFFTFLQRKSSGMRKSRLLEAGVTSFIKITLP